MRLAWMALVAVFAAPGIQPGGSMAANQIPYRVASKPWSPELGNHRAVVHVDAPAEAVKAFIPWRRRDENPAAKDIIVVDLQSGVRVKNVTALSVGLDFGEVVFQAATAGNYAVYYLPYEFQSGWGGYGGGYTAPSNSADPTWRASATKGALPRAELSLFEDRTAFDSIYPMEVPATESELAAFLAGRSEPYLVFPEDRSRTIRMTDRLPVIWVSSGPSSEFKGTALRNEFYAFQLGLFAAKTDLTDVKVAFTALKPAGKGPSIPAKAIRCFNTGGIDTDGKSFVKRVDVAKGRVQALWCGVDVPKSITPGTYRGVAAITSAGVPSTAVKVILTVKPQVLEDRGDSQPWRHSRLRWLDSKVGIDDEVVAPYTPLRINGRNVSCLGRTVKFDMLALPNSIAAGGRELLAGPITFDVLDPSPLMDIIGCADFVSKSKGRVAIEGFRQDDDCNLTTRTEMEFDGTVTVKLTFKTRKDLHLSDCRLTIPIKKEVATYFMGIGRPGGYTPASYDWKWTGPQDSFWIGSVDAGMHCEFRGATYNGPMLNIYHPAPPASWGNDGKGSCLVVHGPRGTIVTAAGGPREMKAGEEVTFEFALLVTPVKPLSTEKHFKERYYHNPAAPAPTKEAVKAGVNVINVHHANNINPYINYPFIATKKMKAFVDKMHAQKMKVKIYYTVRELSNYATEMFALRSLGTEVLAGGGGGGYPWLREHLGTDYTPQWYTPYKDGTADAAILTSGESRWYNYYVEGLGWLVRNVGIDGLYLDDVTYDRRILKRMRKVMEKAKPGCLIDLHSNTGFSIGPANQYAEFFPYVDRLWFGESFNYETMPPEQWLVEVSGIPFGLMGDMLQGGGNRWRGMLYGMTVRLPWESDSNHADPRPVWEVWDSFGIAAAKMVGYWEPNCPVRTDNPTVLATAYVKSGKTLISLASWAPTRVPVHLKIDWKALGLNPSKARLVAPDVEDFQPGAVFKPDDAIPVSPNKGWLLVVEEGSGPVQGARNPLSGFAPLPLGAGVVRVSNRSGTKCELTGDKVEIAAAANSFAFVEYPVPAGSTVFECMVSPGSDKGESWGPGIALVWPTGSIKLYVRSRENRIGVDVNEEQSFSGHVAPGSSVRLRTVLEANRILCQSSDDGLLWETVKSIPRTAFAGAPSWVRFGKTGSAGKAEDYTTPGESGTCLVSNIRARGRK